MARQDMSFQEIILNEILIGKQLVYNDVLETISSIQFEPKTRQVIVETISGKIFTAFKDDIFEWEVLVETPRVIIVNERLKGKIKK